MFARVRIARSTALRMARRPSALGEATCHRAASRDARRRYEGELDITCHVDEASRLGRSGVREEELAIACSRAESTAAASGGHEASASVDAWSIADWVREESVLCVLCQRSAVKRRADAVSY